MAEKKRRVFIRNPDDLDSEGQPRQDIRDKFVGDVGASHGYEELDPNVQPEDVLVNPQAAGSQLPGPPKEAQIVPPGTKEFVRFYDDKTDGPSYSNAQKIAMAAIGLLAPIIGGALGGKQGAYAGAASAAKGIGDTLKADDDYYKKIKAQKFANKSRVLTAMELKELQGAGGKASADGKVKYEWKLGIGADGRPVWKRFNKVTGEVDKSMDTEAYTNAWFKRRPKGLSPADTVTDDDGAVMPNPKRRAPAPEGPTGPAAGGDAAGLEQSNDETFNYDGQAPESKPEDVPGKLPATVGPQPESDTRGKISTAEGKETADFLAQQQMAELDSLMPDDGDLDPTPHGGESFEAAETRAKQAAATKKQVIDKKQALQNDLRKAQEQIAKEDRGEDRAKRLSEFRHNLEKEMAQFRQSIKPASKGSASRRQVMKNAKGQLVDVQTGEVVDANTTPERKSNSPTVATRRVDQRRQDRIAEYDQAIADMQDVLNRVGDHSEWVGVADGRAPAIKGDEAQFRSAIGMMNDSYRHVITGAGAGNRELKMLASRLPNATDVSLDVFKAKAQQYIDKMKRAREIYLGTHGLSENDFGPAMQENLDLQKSQLVPPKEGMVLMQAPDGSKAWVPKERAGYYQKKGGTLIQGGN